MGLGHPVKDVLYHPEISLTVTAVNFHEETNIWLCLIQPGWIIEVSLRFLIFFPSVLGWSKGVKTKYEKNVSTFTIRLEIKQNLNIDNCSSMSYLKPFSTNLMFVVM